MLGSKIDNLQTLKDNGINNIPDFECISFSQSIEDKEDFEKFFKAQINKKPAEASAAIRKYLEDNLNNNFAIKLKAKTYAIRSSSNLEDGMSDSFAGQFKTFLDVKPDCIKEKIHECFMSLCDENVLEYIKRKKLQPKQIEMNVMVQKMIPSELAGVIFTANPQGLLNETVITVGEGLGEKIVSEKTKTTSYYYNRTDDIFYYDGENDYLSDNQIKIIISKIKEIESALGESLDIEFAFADGKIWILQVRPITTIDRSHPLILDNSNIVESYPGISLPLTISFAEYIYSNVFKSECRRMLRDEKELKKHSHIFSQMVGSCNGRMYYKISNWYALINYLPFRKKITKIWEDMLGVKGNHSQSMTTAGARIQARVAKNYLNELQKINKNMSWLNDYFIEVENDFRVSFNKDSSLPECIQKYRYVANQLIPHWDYTLINDMYAFINVGILKKQLGNKANSIVSNITNLESMKPVQEMIRLAYDKNSISSDEYKDRFKEYIRKYGDRNIEELKLESKTFRTNPELLEDKIEEYRKHPTELKKLYDSINRPRQNDTKHIGFFAKKQLRRCENGIRNREISRLNRSRIFGMVRDIFNQIASQLVKENAIDNKDDIYYLRIDEIEKYIQKPYDLKQIIDKRKNEYAVFERLPAYSKLIFADQEFDKHPVMVNSHMQSTPSGELCGTPCSDGKITAKVVVINSAKDQKDTQGKIIVTRSTDPGWVFMLSTAKGIISERGSLLSHTAIISRELGVPSVVGVRDATKILKTGDLVTINGHTGEIIMEKTK